MIAVLASLLLGCARPPLAASLPPQDLSAQFALRFGDHAFAGPAAVHVDAEHLQLDAMTPIGSTLFRVDVADGHAHLEAAVPEMERALAHLPFERDLGLLYRWRCAAERCRAGGGRLQRRPADDGERWSWTGPGGPAELLIGEHLTTLTDTRRGYELRVLGGPVAQ